MRRFVGSLGLVALVTTAIAAPVVAAPSQRFSDTQTELFCNGLANEAGVAFAIAVGSETFGSFAALAFWQAPASPETDDPTWISADGSATFTESSVSATFQIVEFSEPTTPGGPPFGDPVGEATLEATLTPAGPAERYNDSLSGGGNQQFRRSGVIQGYSVSGSLALPEGITYDDLSSCSALRDTFTESQNSPAASVSRFEDFVLACDWVEGETSIFLFAVGGEFGTFSDLFIDGPEVSFFGVAMDPTLTLESYAATFEIFEQTDQGPTDPVGSADASATLTETRERLNERFSFGPERIHITGPTFLVDGALSITTPDATFELEMTAESCFAADQRQTQHVSARNNPGGPPIANDAPEDALPLAIGDEVTLRTGGAASDPEFPCIGFDEIGEFEIPFGKTAWWSIEGTGGEVTLDTAGSSFETVIGVYVADGLDLVPVACGAGVDTPQASLTFGTEMGVTYLVQVGGLFGDAGNLVLTAN